MQRQRSPEELKASTTYNQADDHKRGQPRSPQDALQLRDLSAERMVFKKKNAFPSMLDSGI